MAHTVVTRTTGSVPASLIAMEDSAGATQLPNPMQQPDSPRETGVEEAEIQKNLGEFPGRFTDQGEVQPTPKAAARNAQAQGSGGDPAKPRKRKT